MFGFRKVRVCYFNATAIKPYTDEDDVSDEIPHAPSSSSGTSHHDDIGIPNHYPGIVKNVEGLVQSRYDDMNGDIELFQL